MRVLTIEQVKAEAKIIHKELIKIRRHLHMHPELSYQEKETSEFVKSVLSQYEIPYTAGWAEHGIVAYLDGETSGQRRALRADMDALPIQEANDVPYKSRNLGVMHACGHDVHTSSLLGAAIITKRLRKYLSGTVYFIFQPGEEKLPGGAHLMIEQGLLDVIRPDFMIAQHVYPQLPAGIVGLKAGNYMASADEIYISVKGKGGHAALPQLSNDCVVAAAHLITALQTIKSRNADPFTPMVLTIGKISSVGGATNIIPSEVKMEGTLRTMDEEWRCKAHNKIISVAKNIGDAFDCKIEVNIQKGMPCVFNHEKLTDKIWKFMKTYMGEKHVVEVPARMTAEDFAYFSHRVPCCFYRLGTSNPQKSITSNIHTDTFDIDEDALLIGAGLMAWLALKVEI